MVRDYVVRVVVVDTSNDHEMVSLDVKAFEKGGDAISFAQKIWRKFGRHAD